MNETASSLPNFACDRSPKPCPYDPDTDFMRFVVERVPLDSVYWWWQADIDDGYGERPDGILSRDGESIIGWEESWSEVEDLRSELVDAVDGTLEHFGFEDYPELYGRREEWSTADKICLMLNEFLPERLRYTLSGNTLHRALRDCLWVECEWNRLSRSYPDRADNRWEHLVTALANCISSATYWLKQSMRPFRRGRTPHNPASMVVGLPASINLGDDDDLSDSETLEAGEVHGE